ncbi:SMI1/KNR4 family protein [Streptomyces sp. NPDC056309]|uniref:SMI1/KNR4 family protein n=1 Tax=unclassified Streptomyces TaxID=2593676 RepID=UPI0035D73DCD
MTELFEDSDYYTGPRLDRDMIRRAEEDLGVRLPRSYVEVLLLRNGGTPRYRCYPTSFPTSWAADHFEISGIRGIGGAWGIDSSSGRGSSYLIAE